MFPLENCPHLRFLTARLYIRKLVEMRYTYSGRHIEFEWEGTRRQFRVSRAVAVSEPRKKSRQDTLEKKMNGLSLSGTTDDSIICVVGWDCVIQIVDNSIPPKGRDKVSLFSTIRTTHLLKQP
jgi:hypothetical protein